LECNTGWAFAVMSGNPFQPPAPGSGPTTNALTPPIGQSQPANQAIGQQLIKAIQNLSIAFAKGSSSNTSSTTGASPLPWTPTDGSGAGLAFTNVSANGRLTGGMAFAYGALTFPATANVDNAVIAGFPVNFPNQAYLGPALAYCFGAATGVMLVPIPNSNTAKIVNPIGGTALTNADLSGRTLNFLLTYPTS
jgi:hypothetical protein